MIEGLLDEIWQKKTLIEIFKCRNTATLVCVDGQVLFFQVRDGPFIPHLKLLHQYPAMMPSVTADQGAIKHVLSGSDVMDAGLTSAGGRLPPDDQSLAVGSPVQLLAEGKTSAMAVGVLLKSTADIRKINDGKGIQNYHSIGDGLWNMWTERKQQQQK